VTDNTRGFWRPDAQPTRPRRWLLAILMLEIWLSTFLPRAVESSRAAGSAAA
jgi:hypothetical protein